MNDQERIEKLEKQVKALAHLLGELLSDSTFPSSYLECLYERLVAADLDLR